MLQSAALAHGMTEQRYWRSFGLPLSAWRLIESAKSNPIFQELYPVGSDSDALIWLMRHGANRIEAMKEVSA